MDPRCGPSISPTDHPRLHLLWNKAGRYISSVNALASSRVSKTFLRCARSRHASIPVLFLREDLESEKKTTTTICITRFRVWKTNNTPKNCNQLEHVRPIRPPTTAQVPSSKVQQWQSDLLSRSNHLRHWIRCTWRVPRVSWHDKNKDNANPQKVAKHDTVDLHLFAFSPLPKWISCAARLKLLIALKYPEVDHHNFYGKLHSKTFSAFQKDTPKWKSKWQHVFEHRGILEIGRPTAIIQALHMCMLDHARCFGDLCFNSSVQQLYSILCKMVVARPRLAWAGAPPRLFDFLPQSA